jgi:hypothetical protein
MDNIVACNQQKDIRGGLLSGFTGQYFLKDILPDPVIPPQWFYGWQQIRNVRLYPWEFIERTVPFMHLDTENLYF